MLQADKDAIKFKLESLKNEILADVRSIRKRLAEGDKRHPGRDDGNIYHDAAKNEEDVSIYVHLAEDKRRTLKEIEIAKQKLSEGTYGYCRDCGKEISFKRLEARPFAILCIKCTHSISI